VYVVAQHPCI